MTRAIIVVADDEPLNRFFLATLFGYDGHDVVEAADGVEALDLIRRVRPSLIVADIKMPGLDGYALLGHVRGDSSLCHTPFLFYTAHTELDAAKLHPHSADGVLRKPSEPEAILATVRALL